MRGMESNQDKHDLLKLCDVWYQIPYIWRDPRFVKAELEEVRKDVRYDSRFNPQQDYSISRRSKGEAETGNDNSES